MLQQSSNEPVAPRQPENLLSQLPISSGMVERQDLEVPNTNLTFHSSTIGTTIAYCIAACICATSTPIGSSPLSLFEVFLPIFPIAFYDLYCVVLCSLTIELAVPQNMHWLRILLQSVNIGVFVAGWYFCNIYLADGRPISLYSTSSRSNLAFIGVYVLCAFVHRVIGWTKRRTNC